MPCGFRRAAGAGRDLGYGKPGKDAVLPAGELRGRGKGGYTALQPGYDGKAGAALRQRNCFKMRRKAALFGLVNK